VVFKTHFDLGFTDLPHEVMQQYTGPMFAAVRAVILATEREPEHLRYNWTLPAWPLKFLLHDPSVPAETRHEACELVGQGRLNWHAWPFTTHTAFCGLEELARGLHISRALSEEFGRWPIGAKQTDVPGHTWVLPSLLHGAGVRFLHLGANSGSHAPHVPRLFWWEGPDGARLLTYYSPGGYGTPPLPPEDWPFDTWLALQQTVDNHGPQSTEDLLRLRRTVEQGAPEAELVFGELGDFFESLLSQPEQLADVPVVPYDLADTWIHGVGTMPREVAKVRELRQKLVALEQAVVTHEWPGNGSTASPEQGDFALSRKIAPFIDAAYEQLLLFGEHTWGLDVKSTIKRAYGAAFELARSTEPYRRLEGSWAAKASYVHRAEELYLQALSAAREVVPDIAAEEEPLNYRERNPTPEDEREYVIETDQFRVEVDPAAGGIVSLVDKSTGRDWVDLAGTEPFGGYRYDLYSAADIGEFMRAYGLYFQDWFVQDFGKAGYPEDLPHVTAYARNFLLSKVHAGVKQSLLLSGGQLTETSASGVTLPAQWVSIKITVDEHSPYIDLEYNVTGKQATPLAESTVVPFPFNLPKPTFRLGQVGSVIDPAREISAGANRYLWCVDDWIDASDDRVGLSILPVDMPLVSIGDPGIYRFGADRIPSEPLVYAHLSNTQWGTNFPQWLEGNFTWRVRLAPHAGDWRLGLASRATRAELSRSVSATNKMMASGQFAGFTQQPVEPGTVLTLLSMRPRHDGPGVIVRYSDPMGMPRTTTFSIAGPVSAMWRCDLMERPVEQLNLDLQADRTRVELFLAPHAVVTLLVEFGGEQ
jgi:hypothetical protein